MSDLKREAVKQVLLTAREIMIEHKDDLFGVALSSAFPDHGWGETTWEEEDDQDDEQDEEGEMVLDMEQDAILTCFLVFESEQPGQYRRFIDAAKKYDYSG